MQLHPVLSTIPRSFLAVFAFFALLLTVLSLYLWTLLSHPLFVLSIFVLSIAWLVTVAAYFYWKEWRALPLAFMLFLMICRMTLTFLSANRIIGKTPFTATARDTLGFLIALLSFLAIAYLWNLFASQQKVQHAENKLLESAEELRTMVDYSYDWEVWFGVDGGCKYMSPSCERITGYTWEEFLANPDLFVDIVHPDDQEDVRTHRQQHVLLGFEKSDLEFRLITKSGETRWIWHQCQAALDQKEKWLGRRASNRDITALKEKEEKLRHSELLLKEAQHIAGLGSWELNHQTNVLYWSDEIYHIFDMAPRQFNETFEGFLAQVYPDDQDYVRKTYTDSMADKKQYDIEHRLLLHNGDIKWVREICTTEYNVDGDPIRSLGIVHDITAKHDIEMALRQDRAMFMNGPVVIFIWRDSENWPVEYVSENVLAVLGYSDQDFFNGSVLYSSLIHFDDRKRVAAEVRANSLADSTHFTHEPYRLMARDGKIVWVLDATTLVRDNRGQISHYQGYLVDITRTVQMEEEALDTRDRLEFVIDAARLGTWDWNIQTDEVVYNERWAEILGYTLDELEPNVSTWGKLVHPDEVGEITRALDDHLERRAPLYMTEHRLRHKSGKWVWVLDVGKVFQWDTEGKPLRALGVHLDISRQKEQEQLSLETSQLQEQAKRIESLKTMAGAIAHRFNNSMLVVLGNVEMLRRILPTESKEMNMATMASQAAKEATKVGSSMLTYVGQGEPRLQPENLVEVAREV
ncbi:MAG: PAS domain-containing protein, partial [Desulfocapsaceae bacterium]|nr:PAS domain-containing protein [Desulfocapsaceae bacterium]